MEGKGITMEGLGVIVEFSQSGTAGVENLSCSGVYLGHGLVLTHGTVIIDVLKKSTSTDLCQELLRKKVINWESETDILQSAFTNTKFKVMLQENEEKGKKCSQPSSNKYRDQDLRIMSKEQGSFPITLSPRYESQCAVVSLIFTQDGVTEALASIMPSSQGWRLTEEKNEDFSAQLERLLVSTFVILQIANNSGTELDIERATTGDIVHAVQKIMSSTSNCSKGSSVYIESSPFGSLCPSVFLNSLSHGIISNICGSNGDVLLTDARCVMGSEGAPMFLEGLGRNGFCGLVISPFCWHNGEWLGLTLIASIQPLLSTLLSCLSVESLEMKESKPRKFQNHDTACSRKQSETMLKEALSRGSAEGLEHCIVGVQCGGGWGSGVVINTQPGVVLTCAHVTAPAPSGIVKITLGDGQCVSGQVIHQTKPSTLTLKNNVPSGKSVWDLSVIVTKSPLPAALPLATEMPPEGWSVVVAGHGIFSPNYLATPTVSMGIISKVVRCPAQTLQIPTPKSHTLSSTRIFAPKAEGHQMVMNRASEDGAVEFVMDGKDNCQITKLELEPKHHRTDRVIPIMMQTTCAVYAGTSGGAVVALHPEQGFQVVGIVVCNTKDTVNKATFPHINLAVPVPVIARILQAYISSGDYAQLSDLDVESSGASMLWALGLTPKSKL